MAVLHLDAATLAIDAQAKLVEVARGPARRVEHAQRTIGEIDRHGEAVIGVELVLADLVAGRLVEGLEPREHMFDIEARAERGEIEDVDTDVAEYPVAAVLLAEPPQPLALGAPVTPGLR